MDMVYRNHFEGETPFGRMAHNYYTEHLVSCRAVRNRKDYIKEHIAAAPEGAQILSMAAGPAREIHEYLLESPETTKTFLAVDHDIETLGQFQSKDPRMNYAIGNAFGFIRGQRRVAFPRDLPLFQYNHDPKTDFKGISALMAPLWYSMNTLANHQYDLVYSAGLYDYIESFDVPTKGTVALTKCLFDFVAPGGKLVIGNASTAVPEVDIFVFASVQWPLLYREDHEIMAFADGIDKEHISSITIEKEPLGWNSFLVIEKRG
jgi:Putative methyltransferase